jgi:hypothetical protein
MSETSEPWVINDDSTIDPFKIDTSTYAGQCKKAAHELPTVICGHGEKKPIGQAWQKQAASPLSVHQAASTATPCNIGFIQGPKRGDNPWPCEVIDIEIDVNREIAAHEFAEVLLAATRELTELLPEAPYYCARRGNHYLALYDERLAGLKSNIKLQREKYTLEFRLGTGKAGSQSICPPSIVEGVQRRWIKTPQETPIPSLPDSTIEMLRELGGKKTEVEKDDSVTAEDLEAWLKSNNIEYTKKPKPPTESFKCEGNVVFDVDCGCFGDGEHHAPGHGVVFAKGGYFCFSCKTTKHEGKTFNDFCIAHGVQNPNRKSGGSAQDLLNYSRQHDHYFLSPQGDAFVTFKNHEGYDETRIVDKDYASVIMARACIVNNFNIIEPKEVVKAEQNFTSLIRYSGQVKPVYNRTALIDDTLYIDTGDKEYNVIKLTPTDWKQEAQNPKVSFLRGCNSVAFPKPKPLANGHIIERINLLKPFIHIPEKIFPIIPIYNAYLLYAGGRLPCPALSLIGDTGHGKTSIAQICHRLADPRYLDRLPGQSKNVLDQLVAGLNYLLCTCNNMSHINAEMNDFFCQSIDGMGYSSRRLFTNASEFSLSLCRPYIFTSRLPVVTYPDLLERTIVLDVPNFGEKETRLAPDKYWPEFDKYYEDIWGGILDLVVIGMRNKDKHEVRGNPRMKSFVQFAMALEETVGMKKDTFLPLYNELHVKAATNSIMNDELGAALFAVARGEVGSEHHLTAKDWLASACLLGHYSVPHVGKYFQLHKKAWATAGIELSDELDTHTRSKVWSTKVKTMCYDCNTII